MSRAAFFIINTLAEQRGGLTRAQLLRAYTMAEAGYDVTILTAGFQGHHSKKPDFDTVVSNLRSKGSIHPKSKVLNFWKEKASRGKTGQRNILSILRGFVRGITGREHQVRRKTRRDGDIFVDSLFDTTGKKFATAWRTDKGSIQKLIVHGKKYESLNKCLLEWFEEIVPDNSVFFSDWRQFDVSVTSIKKSKNVKNVMVLHNNHFNPPHDGSTGVGASYARLKTLPTDLIAVLTPQQRDDLVALGFEPSRFAVLPNIYVKPREHLAEKKPRYIATVGRYHTQKRLEDAIRIMKRVADKVPDVRYDLYGWGHEEAMMRDLVAELNLSNVVHVNGYTTEASRIMAEAACTILTSRYEGSPLTAFESMAAGTPVVAYDIKYGPAHVIQDGVNGFLVPASDLDAAAERVIQILTDPDLGRRLAQGALETAAREFSKEAYIGAWENALGQLWSSDVRSRNAPLPIK